MTATSLVPPLVTRRSFRPVKVPRCSDCCPSAPCFRRRITLGALVLTLPTTTFATVSMISRASALSTATYSLLCVLFKIILFGLPLTGILLVRVRAPLKGGGHRFRDRVRLRRRRIATLHGHPKGEFAARHPRLCRIDDTRAEIVFRQHDAIDSIDGGNRIGFPICHQQDAAVGGNTHACGGRTDLRLLVHEVALVPEGNRCTHFRPLAVALAYV